MNIRLTAQAALAGPRSKLAGALLISLLLVVVSYLNTFQSPPVLDDFHTFARNSAIYVNQWSIESVTRLSKTYFGLARWVPMSTFALDYYLGGGNYYQFHLTNLFIHLLGTLAVVFLIRQCLQAVREDPSDFFGLAPAIWIAAIWALNPVQTNAVTYMVQRMASLQALFFTASVACYIKGRLRYLETNALKIPLSWFLLTALFAVLAFFTKENSALLPIMLVVSELWFFSPDGISRSWRWIGSRSWMVKVLIGAVLLLVSIKALLFAHHLWNGYGGRYFGPWERLLTESRVVVWYLGLFLLPLPQRLSIEHDVILSTSLISPPTTLLSIAFLSVLMVLIAIFRKRYRLITFGGAWFFLNLAIESTLVPLELVFEHRLYLPSVGLAMASVCLAIELGGRLRHRLTDKEWGQFAWATVAILCSCLTLLTFYRNEDWRDILTLNQDAASKAPMHPRAHANYAAALLKAGQSKEAIEEGEKALALGRPHFEENAVAANAIIGGYMAEEKWDEAVRRGEEFLANRSPKDDATTLPQLLLRVSESYRRIDQPSKAYHYAMRGIEILQSMGHDSAMLMPFVIGELQSILRASGPRNLDLDNDGTVDPGELSPLTWIAKAFMQQGYYRDAKTVLSAVVGDQWQDIEAEDTLIALNQMMENNQLQGIRWDFGNKYVKHPFSRFNFCMATAYSIRKGKASSLFLGVGEKFLEWAEQLKPADPDVHLLKGWYYYERNQVAAAISEARETLALDPDYAKAWMGLGLFLMNSNQPEAAAAAFEQVLDLYPGYKKRRVIEDMVAQLKGANAPTDSSVEASHGGQSQPRAESPLDLASG